MDSLDEEQHVGAPVDGELISHTAIDTLILVDVPLPLEYAWFSASFALSPV